MPRLSRRAASRFLVYDGTDWARWDACVALPDLRKRSAAKDALHRKKQGNKKPGCKRQTAVLPPRIDSRAVSVCMSCQICVEVWPPSMPFKMERGLQPSTDDRFGGLRAQKAAPRQIRRVLLLDPPHRGPPPWDARPRRGARTAGSPRQKAGAEDKVRSPMRSSPPTNTTRNPPAVNRDDAHIAQLSPTARSDLPCLPSTGCLLRPVRRAADLLRHPLPSAR